MKIYLKRNEYTSYNELGENLSIEKLQEAISKKFRLTTFEFNENGEIVKEIGDMKDKLQKISGPVKTPYGVLVYLFEMKSNRFDKDQTLKGEIRVNLEKKEIRWNLFELFPADYNGAVLSIA